MERAQMLLPFAEREYIDMARCCRILGCSWIAVDYLAEMGEIDLIEWRRRGRKRVRYASLVDYCDRLRVKYNIADRRPPLASPLLRHRDEDLLPFPLSDTITIKEVSDSIGSSSQYSAIKLIEEYAFEAYRRTPEGGSPWNVSRSSFQRYLARVLAPKSNKFALSRDF